MENSPRVLHARYTALHGKRRGTAEGETRLRTGEEPVGGVRLQERAGGAAGGDRRRYNQGSGRCDGGSAEADRNECGLSGARLGHGRTAARQEGETIRR